MKKQNQKTEQENQITLNEINKLWTNVTSNKNFIDNPGNLVGFFSQDPYLQNQRLKQLKSYPIFLDRDTVESALKNPGYSEQALREMSWSLSTNTYPYYKMLRLYSDILSYRHYFYPKYINKKGEVAKDQELISKWIDKFQPERTFRRIALECGIEGKRAYVLRDKMSEDLKDVEYALLQELPSNWWKPTFKSANSYYGISFNFTYFWMPGTTPEQFPPIFQEYYRQLMGCTVDENGIKSINIEKAPSWMNVEYNSRLSKWYLWAELPSDIAWCFSMDETNAWQIPPFIGLFLSLQDLGSYQFLQTQLSTIPLYGILSGEIPYHEDNKGASVTNDLRLSPDLVTQLVEDADGKLPPGVSSVFAPLENIKFTQFQQQVNSSKIYTDVLQQLIATSGLTGLQSTTEKPSVAMVKASQTIESRFADILYGQFNKFMNTVFEDHLNLYNGWRFEIFGNVFDDDKKLADIQKQISMGQSYLLPKMLAYYDLDMTSALSISDWVDSVGIYDKMKVTPNAYVGNMDEDKNGRPQLEEDEIENDDTAKSVDSGLNTGDARV